MINPNDEEWLKRVLEDCFESKSYSNKNCKNLEGFRTLVRNLVKNLEKKVEEAQALCGKKPESKQLKERLHLIEKHLFYLRRFCESKRKYA